MPLGTAGPPGLHAAKLAQGTAGYPGLLDDELEANTAGLSKLEEQGLPADEVADLSKMAPPAQLRGPDHHSDAGQVARSPKRSADGVGLKLMARQPRGTTARQWHGLPSWRGVLFAEEVQPADDQEDSSQASQIIAEPQAFYKLPSGEWWLEYCRMWRATEVQEAMRQGHQGGGRWLPLGTDIAQELFQGVVREHCRLSCVAGNTTAKRSKQLGFISKGKLGAMYFWRTIFDCENLQLLTDAPASKFLQH
eukprot:jgi/Astpho2/6608/fgenesh1_pg.00101_%23_18_t